MQSAEQEEEVSCPAIDTPLRILTFGFFWGLVYYMLQPYAPDQPLISLKTVPNASMLPGHCNEEWTLLHHALLATMVLCGTHTVFKSLSLARPCCGFLRLVALLQICVLLCHVIVIAQGVVIVFWSSSDTDACGGLDILAFVIFYLLGIFVVAPMCYVMACAASAREAVSAEDGEAEVGYERLQV
mmetsp:Transcript_101430/g.262678  ORF Transcript_101430/g.262678 Transcript_101430/m.262678 type:complete len:185 (-) Transcript_101430:64-618(-)